LGTWPEANYLTHLNSDLAGRAKALSIETWTDKDFYKVVATGEECLNIRFGNRAKEALIQKAAGNIGLLQKGLSRVVGGAGVLQTCASTTTIGAPGAVNEAFRKISEEQIDDTFGQFKMIAELGQSHGRWNRRTRMHYLLRAFVADQGSGELRGVRTTRIVTKANELIRRLIPNGEQFDVEHLASVRRILNSDLLAHQRKHLSTPIVFFDSEADALRVTDSWVLLTLRNERSKLAERFEDADRDLLG
jgi:hypothetical protein